MIVNLIIMSFKIPQLMSAIQIVSLKIENCIWPSSSKSLFIFTIQNFK